jgi:hypothetical protein
MPYHVDLPDGSRVERGFTKGRFAGGPEVALDVSDRGVGSVGGEDAEVICYTLRMANEDAITYCWRVGPVIP